MYIYSFAEVSCIYTHVCGRLMYLKSLVASHVYIIISGRFMYIGRAINSSSAGLSSCTTGNILHCAVPDVSGQCTGSSSLMARPNASDSLAPGLTGYGNTGWNRV